MTLEELKELIEQTPNDQILGAKIRQWYWDNYDYD